MITFVTYLSAMLQQKSKIVFFYSSLAFLLLVTCDKPDPFEIPGVYLDFSINIMSDVEYFNLQAAGNSKNITAQAVGQVSLGYNNNGVIVYNGGDRFYAFDRTCTYEFPVNVRVEATGSSAKCPGCESVYVLPSMALPSQGSLSKHPLKEYRTQYNSSTGWLRVYN